MWKFLVQKNHFRIISNINLLHSSYSWTNINSLGAVELGKMFKCTPKQASDVKSFQHHFGSGVIYFWLTQLNNMVILLYLLPFLHLNGYFQRFDIIIFSQYILSYIFSLAFFLMLTKLVAFILSIYLSI